MCGRVYWRLAVSRDLNITMEIGHYFWDAGMFKSEP